MQENYYYNVFLNKLFTSCSGWFLSKNTVKNYTEKTKNSYTNIKSNMLRNDYKRCKKLSAFETACTEKHQMGATVLVYVKRPYRST